jgi:L-2-hydroxycarboxylate dehydrogenase (NAD+)
MQMFKVDEAEAVRVDPERLRATVTRLFERVGVTPEDAALGADHLVRADLRGVESHGVSNMLRRYIQGFREGTLNPRPEWRIVREAPATANVDADRGLGIMVAPKAMAIAIGKARETGVGMVTVRNGGHAGMVSYHAMMALPHDMIGICTTSGGKLAVPTFGREPQLGTNPISFAAPAGSEAPFVFDAATTVIAGNQLQLAHRQGKQLPPGVMAAEDGTPIMEPMVPPPPPYRGHMLPLGTLREMGSHKGYGLSCMVEILGAILAGMPCGARNPRPSMSHFVAAIDVETFTPVAEFKANMDDFLRNLRTTPPAAGHERVVYAGLLEAENERERARRGVPLHPEVLGWFDSICAELDVSPTLAAS